jgi:hypothetical protein
LLLLKEHAGKGEIDPWKSAEDYEERPPEAKKDYERIACAAPSKHAGAVGAAKIDDQNKGPYKIYAEYKKRRNLT